MVSISSDTSAPSLTAMLEEKSSSPLEVIVPTDLHTSISNLPELPPHIKSATAPQRKRNEMQELKAKVKLLGTEVTHKYVHAYS